MTQKKITKEEYEFFVGVLIGVEIVIGGWLIETILSGILK